MLISDRVEANAKCESFSSVFSEICTLPLQANEGSQSIRTESQMCCDFFPVSESTQKFPAHLQAQLQAGQTKITSFKPVSLALEAAEPSRYLIGQSSLSCLRIGRFLAEAVMRPASLSQGSQGYKRRGRADPGSGHLSASYTGQVKRLHQDLNLLYTQDIKAFCFF